MLKENIQEFLEELKLNKKENEDRGFENRVDIDYIIERLEDIEPMEEERTLNERIISIRVKLQNSKLKKSGNNKFAGFDYFELADFLPRLNELMLEEGINDLFTIEGDEVALTLLRGEEEQTYKMPFINFSVPVNKSGQPSMQEIQYLGALNTYYKRYLYLNAFGITDGEVIDRMDNNEYKATKKSTTEKKEVKASPKQIELIQNLVSDIPAMLNYYKVEKIEDLSIQQASEIITKKKGNK